MTTAADEMARLQSHDDLAAQIWHDTRATEGVRELLLAMAWTLLRDPEHPTGREYWKAVRGLLGFDERGKPRLTFLVAADAPRYQSTSRWPPPGCEAPRLRIREEPPAVTTIRCAYPHHPHIGPCKTVKRIGPGDGPATWKPAPPGMVCGANINPELHVVEHDPRTGWRIDHWFCTRHKDQAARVRAQVDAAGEPPEPIPNTGGLMSCYFKADFERLYRDASDKLHLRWEPPGYGLCADDWPTTGRDVALPRKAGLRLIAGGLDGVTA